jgi:hypothetical protein
VRLQYLAFELMLWLHPSADGHDFALTNIVAMNGTFVPNGNRISQPR